MWLILTLVHGFTMAIANYLDEYLTHNNSVVEGENIHKRIWGVFLIGMLFWIFSIIALWFYISDLSITQRGLYLSIFSSIPMVSTWGAYFYLFQKFPAHQIVPLFGLTSFWLLLIEVLSWSTIWFFPFLWVCTLILGAYLLDVWSLSWKIPTKLLLFMLPVTFLWGGSLFLVKLASQTDSIVNIFFYQYVSIVSIGIVLFSFVKNYRAWLIDRVKKQWKNFLWWSAIAEIIAQISFLSSFFAVSLALLATYVSAASSVQYIFLFLLFYLFPLHQRNKISAIQIFSMFLMVVGIFLIEFFK